MSSRLQKRQEEEAAIREDHPHVPPGFLPSPPVYRSWARWVLWEDGCDDLGNFLGFCPSHDPKREVEASAEINFLKGVLRCQGDPRCHPGKRAISLVNLAMLPAVSAHADYG